jgi:hypothetical protein
MTRALGRRRVTAKTARRSLQRAVPMLFGDVD